MRVAEVAGVADRLHEPDGLETLPVLLARVDERIAHLLDELLLVGGRLPLLHRVGLGTRGVLFGHYTLGERERTGRGGLVAPATAGGEPKHRTRGEREEESFQEADPTPLLRVIPGCRSRFTWCT